MLRSRSKSYNKHEGEEVNLLGTVNVNPSSSCRQIEQRVGMPKSSVQKILVRSYKFSLVHNLHPDDSKRRVIWLTQIQIFTEKLCGHMRFILPVTVFSTEHIGHKATNTSYFPGNDRINSGLILPVLFCIELAIT